MRVRKRSGKGALAAPDPDVANAHQPVEAALRFPPDGYGPFAKALDPPRFLLRFTCGLGIDTDDGSCSGTALAAAKSRRMAQIQAGRNPNCGQNRPKSLRTALVS